MGTDKRTWQQLAELAANEKDPDKLRALIRELTEALEQQAKDIPRPTRQHLSKRLLFVDDEEGIRETLPLLLQARGFDVRVAASVPEALSEIRTHKFDVLLSDLNIGEVQRPMSASLPISTASVSGTIRTTRSEKFRSMTLVGFLTSPSVQLS